MERNLSFCFEYAEDRALSPYDEDFPEAVHVTPNPNNVSDMELVLTANACIHALKSKHGLEQALTMIQNAVYGKLNDGTQFDIKWVNPE